jgi:hypothetical protein
MKTNLANAPFSSRRSRTHNPLVPGSNPGGPIAIDTTPAAAVESEIEERPDFDDDDGWDLGEDERVPLDLGSVLRDMPL